MKIKSWLFLSRNLILDLLLTALAPAIWGRPTSSPPSFFPDRPFIAALLRVLPAGIALLIWSRRFPQRGEWAKLIVTGILNIGAFQALLFIAAYRLPGGLAAVIGAIQPLLVMLLAPVCRPAALALAGGVLRHRRHTRYGHAAAVAAHRTRPAGHRRGVSRGDQYGAGHLALPALGALLPIVALTGWQLTIGGVVLAPVALIVDPPLHQVTVLQAAGYLWLCLAGAMLAYGLWFRGLAASHRWPCRR